MARKPGMASRHRRKPLGAVRVREQKEGRRKDGQPGRRGPSTKTSPTVAIERSPSHVAGLDQNSLYRVTMRLDGDR